MAAPHESLPGASLEQCPDLCQVIPAGGGELIDGGGVKAAHLAEFCGVAIDDAGNGGEPAFSIGARRPLVRLQNRICEGGRKRRSDLMRLRDTIKRLLLVEARHFDRPLDRGATSVDFKRAVAALRDGNNPSIELRGIAPIDIQFFFAGALTLLERRIVEKRQPHGAFDLQRAIAAEKHHRRVGIDPFGAPGRTEAGTFQKMKDATLEEALRGCGDRLRVHGCSTAAPDPGPGLDRPSPEAGTAHRAPSGLSRAYRRSSR